VRITSVRITGYGKSDTPVVAFVDVELDGQFVIHECKVLKDGNHRFVAMPSARVTDKCPECRARNYLEANWCNRCGVELAKGRMFHSDGRQRELYHDLLHPLTAEFRSMLESAVFAVLDSETAVVI
jgi:stage V sporulation protein G